MKKRFVELIESNMRAIDRMSDRLKAGADFFGYSRAQLQMIVRLRLSGRAKLKDIARREMTPASNLCALFRNLEKDGLISREIDESDRRNTWYSVSAKGAKLADRAMDLLRTRVEEFFSGISRQDEEKLTDALETINKLLNKMEQ
ncbi:MAG: MarR family transcriptional regulator [Alphaproteobacteria bacterium]|nr:MarR family transcriptional regulator [Alphaproteobacteria bacterium]